MKLIYLGTPQFAVPTLNRLAQTAHEIVAVITQPDRPGGRGMQPTPSPVKTAALEIGLSIMQPEKASSEPVLEEIRRANANVAVVVAYGQMLKKAFLELPPRGCINLHPSMLPRYRGSTPIQSAIMAGDGRTGVTTMLLDEGTDTGDILLQREVEISREDTAGTLHDRLAEAGAELMVESLDAIEAGSVTPRPQDEATATMTRKLTREDTTIDWSRPAEEIFNLTRAMDPLPGCRTFLQGKTLKIWKVRPLEAPAAGDTPGQVLQADGGTLVVQAGDGALEILEMQAAGGRRMSAESFMRGHAIDRGALFGA